MFCDRQLTKQEMKTNRCYNSLCHVINYCPVGSQIPKENLFFMLFETNK